MIKINYESAQWLPYNCLINALVATRYVHATDRYENYTMIRDTTRCCSIEFASRYFRNDRRSPRERVFFFFNLKVNN